MRSRVIGGEFELTAVPNVKAKATGFYSYASGRTALYQILKSIKLTTLKVWLPDWLCESMIDAVKRTGIDYGFYGLNCNLQMDVTKFVEKNKPISENDAIILVNYFGLVDVNQTIAKLSVLKVHSIIIEDDVQALFSFLNENHKADYCFTSLRKSIAAPDGGLVYTKHAMPHVTLANTFSDYKLQGSLIKGAANENTDDNVYLTYFIQGEDLIENNYESVMSDDAACIFINTDFQAVAQKRKENAQYLQDELLKLGIKPIVPITEDKTPLFVPIMVNNRDEIRKELREHGIFCPVHWPLREDMKHLPMGAIMAEKELSLVIDQRYGIEDMNNITEILKKTICK